jgi:hypothetical protein
MQALGSDYSRECSGFYAKTPHKNDIIILFSDAEELGLNGAALL